MPLPEREYYALRELPKRWGIRKRDVKHYAETEKLDCVIWVKPAWMWQGQLIKQSNGTEIFEPEFKSWVTDFVRVTAEQCHWIFHFGKCKCDRFLILNNTHSYYQLCSDEPAQSIACKDLLVMRSEVERFERYYFPEKWREMQQTAFQHSDDYQTIVFKGKEYRFGMIQANIIEQLHAANNTSQRWVHGKILLAKAGSQSLQLKNVFASQPYWRQFIKSDSRGYYCLNT